MVPTIDIEVENYSEAEVLEQFETDIYVSVLDILEDQFRCLLKSRYETKAAYIRSILKLRKLDPENPRLDLYEGVIKKLNGRINDAKLQLEDVQEALLGLHEGGVEIPWIESVVGSEYFDDE